MTLVTLQTIFQDAFPAYEQTHLLPAHVRTAARAIMECRTVSLGGHIQACPDGHFMRVWYNACRHRACPQCAFLQTERWLALQRARLLACDHSQVIFTLPYDLNPLWLAHVPVMSTLLLQAARDTRCALLVTCRRAARTVAAWWARAGQQEQAVHKAVVEPPRDLGQVPADESRVKMQGDLVWMALAVRVRPRVWLAGAVRTHRDRPLRRRLIERVYRCAAPRPRLCCPDGVCASVRAMCETLRDAVSPGRQGRPRLRLWRNRCMAQVVQRSTQRRRVDVERRLVAGPPARVETLRCRSHGPGVIKTASIERRNATLRARLVALTRRGRARARRPLTLPHGMSLVETVENFWTLHTSLSRVGSATTPATATGITDHGWSVQALWSYHVPPPRWTPPQQRGRPSHALKRLRERWCGDHG